MWKNLKALLTTKRKTGGNDVRPEPEPRAWSALDPTRQLELREAHGHYLDQLPPTCDPAEKERRFAAWLARLQVIYPTPTDTSSVEPNYSIPIPKETGP